MAANAKRSEVVERCAASLGADLAGRNIPA
jgi:hypothetical protein